jgi:chemotaxis family two-component system response regulator Rcp1
MAGGKAGKTVGILLVEDNRADVRLTFEVLKEQDGRFDFDVTVAGDGEAALALLRREGEYAAAPRPDLILLDLRLPRVDGLELLAQIKAEPKFRRLPVIVLTSSQAEADVARAYDLGAACYVAKPMDLAAFIDVVGNLLRFWVGTVTLPSE